MTTEAAETAPPGRSHDAGRPRPAGRWLAWRLHLGRAGPPAAGAVAAHRRRIRHVGRRHERRRAGRRLRRGRRRRRPRRAGEFLAAVSQAALLSPFRRTPLDVLLGRWTLDYSPMFVAMDMMSRVFSPYNLGQHAANPLQGILSECIDFDRLARAPIKLFVTATNVRTGRGRVFRNPEITPDVLLASACLPTLFQAVEIDGEVYWDGGYSGNPTMTPLVRECESRDTILVQINPVERPEIPRSARDILNRLNEVSFNAVLLKELRMMALLRQVSHPDKYGRRQLGRHAGAPRSPATSWSTLGYSSKLNAEWEFLCMLRDAGRRCAEFVPDRARRRSRPALHASISISCSRASDPASEVRTIRQFRDNLHFRKHAGPWATRHDHDTSSGHCSGSAPPCSCSPRSTSRSRSSRRSPSRCSSSRSPGRCRAGCSQRCRSSWRCRHACSRSSIIITVMGWLMIWGFSKIARG